jgi:Galactose oxidase, central domain
VESETIDKGCLIQINRMFGSKENLFFTVRPLFFSEPRGCLGAYLGSAPECNAFLKNPNGSLLLSFSSNTINFGCNLENFNLFCYSFFVDRGKAPAPRFDHIATVHAEQYLLIFGGSSHATCFNDLHLLDLQTVHAYISLSLYIYKPCENKHSI